jgi:hypothetical protein
MDEYEPVELRVVACGSYRSGRRRRGVLFQPRESAAAQTLVAASTLNDLPLTPQQTG